ncbi:MAG: glycogen/starch synthase [Candidatus Nanoarchaeia archaeon]
MDASRCLCEVAWEVCNKVGGIYTVVQSKAAIIQEKFQSYMLIGPYFREKARVDFEELEVPDEFKPAYDSLSNEGIKCHYGKWLIKGEPKCTLIDASGFIGKKDEIKKILWDEYKIDSLNTGWDFEEPMLWSWAAGMLIEQLGRGADEKGIAHFHEWLAGFGLLYLKWKNSSARTVFTTHATTLGRTLASAERDIYDDIASIDPNKEAYYYQVQAKHLTEVECAKNATVFTTVSETTAQEAEHFIGRKVDVILANGLDISKFPTMEEAAVSHRHNRQVIREFISYFFLPHYYFDTNETLFFFIVGRYEMKNKGIDLFIDALARLNDRLKEEGFGKTIVAFFWIPREVHGTNVEISANKIAYDAIKNYILDTTKMTQQKILDTVMMNERPESYLSERSFTQGQLFDRNTLQDFKKLRLAFAKKGNAPIATHNLPYQEQDAIIRRLVDSGLDNKPDDKVKAVFYPVYLTGVDGLLDLPYYEAIMGCHLGLFPSYYEPWGYTPLETAALGVPSLTTDLAGFGRFLQSKDPSPSGIRVLPRLNKKREEVINAFSQVMYDYAHLGKQERVNEKIVAKRKAALADWSILIKNYIKAYDKALK